MKYAYLIGQTFGSWEVLDIIKVSVGSKGKKHNKALCRCVCGKESFVGITALRIGRSSSCGCSKARYLKTRGERHVQYTGYKDISGSLWTHIKNRAARRNLEFLITIEEAWAIYENQNRLCALTGDYLYFGYSNHSAREANASLDRIDNSLGYITGNVRWVTKEVNLSRNRLSTEEFVEFCKIICEHNGIKT